MKSGVTPAGFTVVRAKMYQPGLDNLGSRWREVTVDSYGTGSLVITCHRPVHWTKFRVATRDNERVLQEHFIRAGGRGDEPAGIVAEGGDVVSVDFVVHELAFRVRLNDDPDDEDLALLGMVRLARHLRQ